MTPAASLSRRSGKLNPGRPVGDMEPGTIIAAFAPTIDGEYVYVAASSGQKAARMRSFLPPPPYVPTYSACAALLRGRVVRSYGNESKDRRALGDKVWLAVKLNAFHQ